MDQQKDHIVFGTQGGKAFHRAIALMAELFSREHWSLQDDALGLIDESCLRRLSAAEEKDCHMLRDLFDEHRAHHKAMAEREKHRITVQNTARSRQLSAEEERESRTLRDLHAKYRAFRLSVRERQVHRVAVYDAALAFAQKKARRDPSLDKFVTRLGIRRSPSGKIERVLRRACW
jgi:hypothetical protein